MGLLDRAFAAAYDPVLANAERAGLGAKRRELLGSLAGHVVEIGAGTGANLPYLGPEVDRATLLEPTPEMAAKLRARIGGGTGDAPDHVEVVEAPAEALPVGDADADVVVSTLVLCSVGDLHRSLTEIRRVLKPGGALIVLEHVGSTGRSRRLQRAIEPAWRYVARGCNLTRDTLTALTTAGFDTTEVLPWGLPGGGPTGSAIAGTARPLH